MASRKSKHPEFLLPAMPPPWDILNCPACDAMLVRIHHPDGPKWLNGTMLNPRSSRGKGLKHVPEHRNVCTKLTAGVWTPPIDPDPEWL